MDCVSVLYTRAAVLWLVAGVTLGALMLSDTLIPGTWRLWFAPTHGHILFVSWFLQFAVGVGYWLLPRKRLPATPFGYDERLALTGMAILNLGLVLRVIAEPASRLGYEGRLDDYVLAASSVAQLVAILIIARQIWRRLMPKPRKQSQ